MRFVIVFAVILAVAVAASQQEAADGDVADNTVVTIDDVIGGADFTLEALLDGRVTGLSEHSTNGVQGVAFTNAGYLVGFPIQVQAILIGLFDSIPEGFKPYNEARISNINGILCFTANWINNCNLVNMHASMLLGSVVCDSINKPIPSGLLHRTPEGTYVSSDYLEYHVCFVERVIATVRTYINTMLRFIPPLDCTVYYKEVVSGKSS